MPSATLSMNMIWLGGATRVARLHPEGDVEIVWGAPPDHFDPADRLCLDFANTVGWRRSRPDERLGDYDALLAWARRRGLLDTPRAARLAEAARARPALVEAVMARAHALREAIYRIFCAVAAGERADPAALGLLNAELAAALGRTSVVLSGDGYTLAVTDDPEALDQVLAQVARSAAELLTSPDLGSVRACAAEWCGWLFVDRSHGQRRRWCTMKVCGNRVKTRRHYARTRGRDAEAARA